MLKFLLSMGFFLALINFSISLEKNEKGKRWKTGMDLVERVLKKRQAIKFNEEGRITEIDGDKVREVKNLFVELTGLPFGSEVGQPCLHAAKFGMRAGTLAEEIKQKGHEGLKEMDMEWNQMIPLLHLHLEQIPSASLDMDEMECLAFVNEVEHESGDQFYKYDLYTQMMTGHDMKGKKKIKTNNEKDKLPRKVTHNAASKMEIWVALVVLVCFAMLEYVK